MSNCDRLPSFGSLSVFRLLSFKVFKDFKVVKDLRDFKSLLKKSGWITHRSTYVHESIGKQFGDHAKFMRRIEWKFYTEIDGFAIAESRIIVLMPEQNGSSVSERSRHFMRRFEQHSAYSSILKLRQDCKRSNSQRCCNSILRNDFHLRKQYIPYDSPAIGFSHQ